MATRYLCRVILLYRIFLVLYVLGVRIASLWKPKARSLLAGRRGQWQRLADSVPARKPGQKRFWIHCASLGEFEQGRPVIEAIRYDWPDAVIILSFFSPSGYEIRKDYDQADVVCYLPMDGPANARRFIDLVDPDAALFVKYEFWHYYLKTLQQRGIPAILVSGAFRESQPFFKPWGWFFRNILQRFSVLAVQDEGSLDLLRKIGLGEKAILSGDTRYDRVLEIARQPREIGTVDAFRGESSDRIIVAGSTWPKDEEMLATAWPNLEAQSQSSIRLIIAPHELGEAHISAIEGLFKTVGTTARFSDPIGKVSAARILIIDNMGMLSSLYRYGDVAFIGGGFNAGGIHNVLEPAVFGLPVIMGPVYQKFTEAVELQDAGFAFPVTDDTAFVQQATILLVGSNAQHLAEQQSALREFVKSRGGATGRVMDVLRKVL